jgi:hypothetical protein
MLEDKADKDVVEGATVEGGSRMSPRTNSTFDKPAASTRRLAAAIEAEEMSIEVIRAAGLRRPRMTD